MNSFWLYQSFGCCLLHEFLLFCFRLLRCIFPSFYEILLYIFVDSFFFICLSFLLSCYLYICFCLGILHFLSYLIFLNLRFTLKILDLFFLLSFNSFDFTLFCSCCSCYFFFMCLIEFLDGNLLFFLNLADCVVPLFFNLVDCVVLLSIFLVDFSLVLSLLVSHISIVLDY